MGASREVVFDGHDGHRLSARLETPPGVARGVALFAHCFSCSKDVLAARRVAEGLVAEGFAVLRFDFTGLGLSEGDFANTNFSTNVQDLVAAGHWLAANLGGPDLLIGHSLGGAAAIVAASELPMVRAVATIGAPSEAEHVLKTFGTGLEVVETHGEAEVSLAGRPFQVKRQFVEDVRGAKVREAAGRLGRPLMIMHAPLDPVVGVENASALFLAARHPKSFVSLDGADHLLTRREDAVFVARTLAAWAGRYVPDARVGFAAPAPGAPGEVMVAEAGGGKFVNWVVTADGHRMLADEPVAAGGTGLGPDPYEFVKAGLGACTAMTLRMYASRKGWPLERVQVAVSFTREHRDDCEHCEEGKPELVGVFRRRLMLEGPLDAEQRARLMEIADRCPVHRTLSQSSVIETIAG